MARVAGRTRITEDWQPDEAGREFAASKGVPDGEVGAFVDYHLAKGDLMASWPAAWRTWCRHAVQYGRAAGRPAAPLLALVPRINQADPWGICDWIKGLPDVGFATRLGETIVALCGVDIGLQACECCEAAGFPPDWRGDLNPVAEWLRAGLDPDLTVEAIRTATKRPDRPNLKWYDIRVRERARAA